MNIVDDSLMIPYAFNILILSLQFRFKLIYRSISYTSI